MTLPTGTPSTAESKGLTWMITGSFKSVKGELKFLANSSVYNSSISTVSKLKWLAINSGSPRTSLIPTGSKEPSVSNLRLWGKGGGSNAVRGGRFLNLLDLLTSWSSRIKNLTNHTLRSTKHKQIHRAYTKKILESQAIKPGYKDILSRRKLMNDYLASLRWFLGTSGGITHRPPTLSTRVTFQARSR